MTGTEGALPLAKLCEVEDFAHPDVRDVVREVFPHEVVRLGSAFPVGREYRKHWEVAMAVRALRARGLLDGRAQVLGVGAGNEPTLFWLTGQVGRVFATDLYLQPGAWQASAPPSMLVDPGVEWPGPWNPRRLVVQHMDARALRYEDGSFDAVFSSSSFEHFGTRDDVRAAVREAHRVLRPGGVLSVATEFRLAGPPEGLPGILLFDRDDMERLFAGAAPWSWVAPLDTRMSQASLDAACDFEGAAADVRAHVAEHGGIRYHLLEWSVYPHVVLRHGPYTWTSVHVCMVK